MDNKALLGIEAGGTRTVALLVVPGAQPIQAEFGPANLRLLSDRELVGRLKEVRAFYNGAPALAGIAIGMAGARTEADRARICKAAAEIWPKMPCYATNDLETALAAGASSENATRILVLSGTGSCFYGQTPQGETFRFGGWGHILGDQGSAYAIALSALQRVVFDFDVRGRLSELGRQILRALQLNEPDGLIDWVKGAEKTQIAALAVEVCEAAKRDKLAAGVLAQAAEDLAQGGVQCARHLAKKNTRVEFVLSGGILLKQPRFAKKVRRRLLELWPEGRVQSLQRESVWGAIELAKNHFGRSAAFCEGASISKKCSSEVEIPKSLKLSPTEMRNPRSMQLDKLSLREAIALMAREDAGIPQALMREAAPIERAIELIVRALKKGGRLFYVGAGSSGRLGVLDASEIPPTFRADPEMVQGIIAGGYTALWRSIEGAEDSPSAGATAIEFRAVTKRDVVVGIAASGRTPFVWGALAAAKKRGAATVLLCFNPNLAFTPGCRPNVVIAPNVGPEILTGSTRLKAGTATKMVLNMLTTLSMVRLGKVMSNLMVDLNASNQKLRERAARIVEAITGAPAHEAQEALAQSRWIVKDACRRLKPKKRRGCE